MLVYNTNTDKPESTLKKAIESGCGGVFFRLKSTAVRAINKVGKAHVRFFIDEFQDEVFVSWKLPR